MDPSTSTIKGIEAGRDVIAGGDIVINQQCHNRCVSSERMPIGAIGLPEKSMLFVGRRKELALIERKLDSERQLVILQGMASAGKTTIARQCVENYGKTFTNIIWINAETKSSIFTRFKNLARRTEAMEGKVIDQLQEFNRDDIELIYSRLCDHPTLVVFDNAESYLDLDLPAHVDGVSLYYMQPSVHFKHALKTIITTRYENRWETISKEEDVISIQRMQFEDCQTFITTALGDSVTDAMSTWMELAVFYDCLPIAIESSIGFVKFFAKERRLSGQTYSLPEFMKQLQIQGEIEDETLTAYNATHKKVLRMWDKALETLESGHGNVGKVAVQILNVLAFFTPVVIDSKHLINFVERLEIDTVETITRTTTSGHAPRTVEKALLILHEASLVQSFHYTGRTSASMHRLLMDNRMHYLKRTGKYFQYAASLVKNIQSATTFTVSRFPWVCYAEEVKEFANKLSSDHLEFSDELVDAIVEEAPVAFSEALFAKVHKTLLSRATESKTPLHHGSFERLNLLQKANPSTVFSLWPEIKNYWNMLTQNEGIREPIVMEARETTVNILVRSCVLQKSPQCWQHIIELLHVAFHREVEQFDIDHKFAAETKQQILMYLTAAKISSDSYSCLKSNVMHLCNV